MNQREEFLKSLDARDIVNNDNSVSMSNNQKRNTKRSDIRPGTKVLIVQKHHQKTGELTEGIVKDILTNSQDHHRGIKVRLQSGIVGRVQKIL